MHLYLSKFVCWVHYCSKLCQSSPWKPRREASLFQNCQIQTASLSQRSQSLIKPLLKNSFSTVSQGPGPGEAPFHFSRFVCWAHYCSKLCQSSSWKPRREASLFQKPNSNSKPFPKEPIPSIKEQLFHNFPRPWTKRGFISSRFVCWVHNCKCQSSSWKPRREASLFQRQLKAQAFRKEPIPY